MIGTVSAVGLDDFVGQVVAERRGDGQGLHLLSAHHPAERHPAHVLQTANAARTLPEAHSTVTSPATERNSSDKSKRGEVEELGINHRTATKQ